jgi:hypothetical protein
MRLAAALACAALAACASIAPGPASRSDLTREVERTERAFAKTMADRDAAAFASFLSEEAVFFSGEEALRGKAAVSAQWARFFTAPEAPFSWEPDRVEVLDSGTLALSTGPVRNARGKLIARFAAIAPPADEKPGLQAVEKQTLDEIAALRSRRRRGARSGPRQRGNGPGMDRERGRLAREGRILAYEREAPRTGL